MCLSIVTTCVKNVLFCYRFVVKWKRDQIVNGLCWYEWLVKYSYVSEREHMISRLQESVHLSTLTDVGWSRMMSLSGARLPDGGDQLSYPAGTVLEPLRQGLLTYNTYVSALDLPAASVPAMSHVSVEGNARHENDRVWYVGEVSVCAGADVQWLDALDTVEKWLEATVYAVSGEFVLVHYNGWPSTWDEWIHRVVACACSDA